MASFTRSDAQLCLPWATSSSPRCCLAQSRGWSFPDCAYFAIITLTTVGYGDLTPATDAGKVLSAAFAVGGLIVVTASLTELIEAVVSHRRALEVQASLRQIDETTSLIEKAQQPPTHGAARPARSSDDVGAADWWSDFLRRSGVDFRRDSSPRRGRVCSIGCAAPRSRLEPADGAPLLLLAICGGTCLGYYVEGWCAVDSAYFALISILTVGYGDFSPSTRLGRTLCTLLLPVACARLAALRLPSRRRARLRRQGAQIGARPPAMGREGGRSV